ncbi:hypothetical protein A9239_04580 [Methanosarcina sp. A14]|nr:hypothetical protein A9239_04580 [Methanosarcina sp. A14]
MWGLGEVYLNVGIDVAKNVHEACILTESGEQIGNFIQIKNSKSSVQKFRVHLAALLWIVCQFFCKIINIKKLWSRKFHIGRSIIYIVRKNLNSNLQKIRHTA